MNEIISKAVVSTPTPRLSRLGLTVLLCCQIVTCCLSLVWAADLYNKFGYVMYDRIHLPVAVFNVTAFAAVSALFIFGRYSFGYVLGYYFYNLITGYLWLVTFSRFNYDHTSASISAFVSAVAFLLPALLVTAPIRQRLVLSERALDLLLKGILIWAIAVIAAGALYNFRMVGLAEIYKFRNDLAFPAALNYALGATSNALLPFAFACFVERGNRWKAAAVLLLLLLFYPITLAKLTLFAPVWLLFLALLAKLINTRAAVVLSLFLPTMAGVIALLMFHYEIPKYAPLVNYFSLVNFRMIAIPSLALDYYNDFFSTHPHTYFCQISLLKPFVSCPYSEPLGIVMEKAYHFGNFNASLFATEGVASVGLVLAPLVALVCGLLIGLANRLSSGLPSRFILLSSGILLQVFMNVPMSTTLLTYGAALLFVLWYVTPRATFSGNDAVQ
jgi:hypothetical protein